MPRKKKPTQPNAPTEDPLVAVAWKFRDDNQGLSLAPSGMSIWFAPDGKGALTMTVTIPEGLTRTRYLRAWPTINAWRERLTALMGRQAFSSQEQQLRRLAAKHPQRSYRQLADEMNGRIEKILHVMLGCHQRQDINQLRLCAVILRHHFSTFCVNPHDLHQKGLTLTWEVIEAWSLGCCARLAEGQSAFDGNPPIGREHLVRCLRPYRKR